MTWSGSCSADGRATGRGVLEWRWEQDGQQQSTRYEGEFRDGKANGRGVVTFPDGGRYEGEFRDGKPHGIGSRTLADGSTYTGRWTNGCFRQGRRWATIGTTPEECGFK